MIAIGIDIGSSKTGICAADDAIPLRAGTVERGADETDDAYAARVVDTVRAAVEEEHAERAVIEWGPYYCRPYPGEAPDAFARRAAAQQRNRDAAVRMLGGIETVCRAASVEVRKIPAATWRGRIGATVAREPGDRGRKMKQDAAVRGELERRLGERMSVLRDVHQRDAFGALLGVLLTPPKEKPVKVPGERTRQAPTRVGPDPGTVSRIDAIVELLNTRGVTSQGDIAEAMGITPHALGMMLKRVAIPSGRVIKVGWGKYSVPTPQPQQPTT